MAKIRTIKPELFRHEELFEAEVQSKLPLRLSFIGLLTCCDREGRFKWTPRSLKLDIIPYDDSIDFAAVLDALLSAGFVKKYEVNGRQYGYIPTWHFHQVINKREPASRFPSPYPSEFSTSQIQDVNWQMASPVDSYAIAGVGIHMSGRQFDVPNASFHMPLKAEETQVVSISSTASPSNKANKSREISSGTGDAESATSVLSPAEASTHLLSASESIDMSDGSTLILTSNPAVQPIPLKSVKKSDVIAVFNQWKLILNHPTAVLDNKRHQIIEQALALGYSVHQLSDAIRGCSQTPYYMGDNDRGQRYDGLHLIFKDADRIEQFIKNGIEPPLPPSKANRLEQSNQIAAERFVEKMKAEYAALAESAA